MTKHPFIETYYRKVELFIVFALLVVLFAVLLHLYVGIPLQASFYDSILSLGLLLLAGYLFWFIVDAVHTPVAEFILSIGVLLLWLGLCLGVQFIDIPYDESFINTYLYILPLRLAIGALSWLALVLWYRSMRLQRWKRERLLNESLQVQTTEIIDRIAVKNGSRIHVISVKDLIYIQACGDYAMLFTPAGEFLKEQTMKSLEAILPENFTRIHRSFIVNIEQIDRVELYGKETYHVQLKNGNSLRASISGYKLLKEKLAL